MVKDQFIKKTSVLKGKHLTTELQNSVHTITVIAEKKGIHPQM